MTLTFAVGVCTHGDEKWKALAEERAIPSLRRRDPDDLLDVPSWVTSHASGLTLAEVRNMVAGTMDHDFIAFLDADDELAPGYFAAMRRAFHRWNLWRPYDVAENPLLFVPAIQYVDAGVVSHPRIPDWDRSLIDLNCACVGTLIPRRLFVEVGGFRELPSLEDWDLVLRCVEAGARMVPVRDAVYRVFRSAEGRNRDQSPYHAIRAEHAGRFDWGAVSRYKVES